MQSIATILGLLPRDELEVREVVTDEAQATLVATEYRYHGQLVRRDVEARLKPIDLTLEAKEM